MRLWHIMRSRLRSLVFRGRRESDLSEELQLHLERETERLQASGLSPEAARLQAARLFGGVEQVKEECRDARGTAALEALARDTCYGLRRLVRDWRFTTAAVLITARMARQYFGAVDAVGRRFRLQADPNSWTEVIGVARDTGTGDLDNDVLDPIGPPFYVSYTQSGSPPTTALARTTGDAARLVAAMQRELRAIDVTLPVVTAQTMAQKLENAHAAPKVIATLFGALAGLGLVLASIGLYAVVAFAVARRSREIGVRMALGARSQQVVWSIVRG